MKKDEIFFGENGLTTTSANHTANLAKEKYQVMLNDLNGVTLFNTYVGLIGSQERQTIKEGRKSLDGTEDTLLKIAQLKSLIAWLREAIKAKNNLFEEASRSNFGVEMPERPTPVVPITADDYIATWDIKKRNRYYYLDTVCSTIGSYIHPNGAFAEARKKYMEKLTNPRTTQGDGRDMVIYEYTPSIPTEEVEKTFMDMQATYRKYQAELNSLKFETEEAVKKSQMEALNANSIANAEYNKLVSEATDKIAKMREDENKRISDLRIVIPNSLQDIYKSL